MEKEIKKLIDQISSEKPVFWKNIYKEDTEDALRKCGMKMDDILDAEERLVRFAPFFRKAFPETGSGIIESELAGAPAFASAVSGKNLNLLLKCDDSLPVAGSIKARGGIYEILKYAETLVLEHGSAARLPAPDGADSYSVFASDEYKKFFSRYHVAVGSTGNLGLSIGTISAKLGFDVTIHMSHDAKEWKKDKLRSIGAKVVEYKDLYSKAVEEGRKSCEGDPFSYFVDDENSKDLFLGYSTAALRLEKQLEKMGMLPDEKRSLNVYLPCGVGGAPGGITFGLKHVFGNRVRCFFAEPVKAPSVILGFLAGRKINTADFGLALDTDADGLAVDSPSQLVLDTCKGLIDGFYTCTDEQMYKNLYLVRKYENRKIEVSAAASLCGLSSGALEQAGPDDIHIAWLTGGSFIPESEYSVMAEKGRRLSET